MKYAVCFTQVILIIPPHQDWFWFWLSPSLFAAAGPERGEAWKLRVRLDSSQKYFLVTFMSSWIDGKKNLALFFIHVVHVDKLRSSASWVLGVDVLALIDGEQTEQLSIHSNIKSWLVHRNKTCQHLIGGADSDIGRLFCCMVEDVY